MSKIKDLLGIERIFKEVTKPLLSIQEGIRVDLYSSIKEVAELKYRIVEMEVRIGNLEEMVKILMKEGG